MCLLSMLTLSEVEQDVSTGELKVVKIKNLDFKELVDPSFHYISEPCSGSVTPWSTFLSSQVKILISFFNCSLDLCQRHNLSHDNVDEIGLFDFWGGGK